MSHPPEDNLFVDCLVDRIERARERESEGERNGKCKVQSWSSKKRVTSH